MSKERLTKNEAIRLISSVIDDEVDQSTRYSFFEYIENDSEVRNEFESIKRIKQLVAERCPTHKAPDTLKLKVQEFLMEKRDNPGKMDSNTNESTGTVDVPTHIPDTETSSEKTDINREKANSSTYNKWLYAAAASFLILAAFWGILYNQSSLQTYNMEEYVYQHFEKNDGKLVPPNITTASLTDAEVSLSSNYNMSMTVPHLKNAEFKGVAINEFVPGYEAPLLEYYLPSEDQYIYIFAFEEGRLDNFDSLVRSNEAVKKCVKPEDFHIKNVNGKHVVSWRWDGIWYAAISNHNGKTLASLIEPLRFEPESGN